MGRPDPDLPLDLDSSPWRRWSPILLDVAVVLVSLHLLRALLVAFFPYGMAAGWYASRGEALLDRLLALPPGFGGGWLPWLGWVVVLALMRVGSGLLGWHRLIFCAAIPLAAILMHVWIATGY